MMQTIPTREAVSKSWNAYSKLCQAAADDPALLADHHYTEAVDNARARWSAAFIKWDGK